MTSRFHRILNRMALFTALLACGLILFWAPFMQIAISNIYLNGIIIGAALFGVGLCFVEMFRLVPEYRWARAFFKGNKNAALPPRLLRPVAIIMRRGGRVPVTTLGAMLDMILLRMEDSRESVRYITNTLVFLGLLDIVFCASCSCSPRKPTVKLPAKPIRELVNAVAIPDSGRARPACMASRTASSLKFRLPIKSAKPPTVTTSPQNVPSRPRKTSVFVI